MVENVIAHFCRCDHEHKPFFDFFLPAEFTENRGAKGEIKGGGGGFCRVGIKIFRHKIKSLSGLRRGRG